MVIDENGQVVGTDVIGKARREDVRTLVDWLLRAETVHARPPLLKRC